MRFQHRPAQNALLAENAQPTGEVWNLWDSRIEVNQKGEVVLARFVSLPESVGNRDPVDTFTKVAQIPHRAINATEPFKRKIVDRELADLFEPAIVQQDRSEDKTLRVPDSSLSKSLISRQTSSPKAKSPSASSGRGPSSASSLTSLKTTGAGSNTGSDRRTSRSSMLP